VSGTLEATFSLPTTVTAESLSGLRAQILQGARDGLRQVRLDLNGLAVLDAAVISTLISILRDVRGVGGDVVLRTDRRPILDTLRVTGLDKVFGLERGGSATQLPARAAAAARKPRRMRWVASLAAFVSGGLILALPASAGTETNAADVVRNVLSQNPDMHTYQSRVSVDFHLQSFPYLSQHLDGMTYFKRPDNFEVVFRRVPTYAKGFDKLYSDIDDPTSWERRFDMSVVGEREVAGHRDLVLRLIQKVRGMIDHQDVAVDPSTWRIDNMEWHYYNGGVISMSQDFMRVGDFNVLAAQHATIRIPYVHAAADARYDGYQTNVALDDAIFTKEKK